jgi:putative ABC transport system permease protein
MGSLFQDLRYGLRQLANSPGFTLVAALTLALGIGAHAAVFSVINPILIEPLPYPQPDRLMMIWSTFEGARSEVAFHNFREIAARNHSFEKLAILEPWQPTMTGTTQPERLDGQNVSADYFEVLGISPMLGRDFQAGDDAFHGRKVAIVSYGLWQRRFGGERGAVGRLVTLDGDAYTVIGVMPPGFENVPAGSAEIWSPTQYDPSHIGDTDTSEWGNHLRLIGRRRPGVTFEQARADLEAIARTPTEEFPRVKWASLRSGFILDSLKEDVTRGVRPALLAVFGAVVLVLLIACLNVTNLLLARGTARRGEFAMRAALGASRGRMIRQMLTESVLLSLLGGVLGIFLAQFGVQAMVALSPAEVPRLGEIHLDRAAFAFAFGVSSLIGLAVGLVPALHTTRTDLRTSLQEGSRQTAGGQHRMRRALVVAEVALALVLLVGAGLLLRSASRLLSVDPGFQAVNLLTMQVQTSGHQFDRPAATRRFFEGALENVRRVRGVQAAAFTSILPLTDDSQFGEYGTHFEKDGSGYNSFRYVVTPGYFEVMRIPLRHGRYLDAGDRADAPFAVVISESLAKKEFATASDAIGQRVHVGPMERPWYTIVGVVSDVKQVSLAAGLTDDVYITSEQSWFADQAQSLVARSSGNAASLLPAIQRAIWAVDKDQPIIRISSMEELLARSAAERHFVLVLFDFFGLLALALAAIGLYGVISGSVSERTREIGVRLALGAQRGNILALIFRQGLTLTAAGMTVGLGGALAAGQTIRSLLYGVSAFDMVTYLGVVALLGGVSAAACWIPARRAVRLDPMAALRHE